MRRTKTQKGITLIALIITIIVLLILAAVAIGAVQNDGIIRYANNARGTYEEAKGNETSTLEGYLSKIEEETSLAKGKIVKEKNEIYTRTVGGKTLTAVIPVGFCIVKDVEGDANTIERGLVISDVADDDLANSKGGNQFVWIPVEDYSKFKLIEGYSNKNLQEIVRDQTNPSKEAGDTDAAGSPSPTNNVAGTEESKAMYKSVKDNKGFYIARFEAGVPTDVVRRDDGTVKPLSQKKVDTWKAINWGRGTAASDGLCGDDNANGAVKVARSMYAKSSECGVTSTLCYGVQWDAVMNFIDSDYYKQDGTLTGFVANVGDYYEQNHIFNLAGNVYEWTMEAYVLDDGITPVRIARGDGLYSASARLPKAPGLTQHAGGFRVALYL